MLKKLKNIWEWRENKLSLFKEYIKRFLKGIPIGVFIGQIFITISLCIFKNTIVWNDLLFENIAFGLIGGYFYGTSIIYFIDSWSILKQNIVQWIMFLPFFPLAWILGWIPRTMYSAIGFIILYFIFIFIIWFYYKRKYKNYVNEMNESLKRIRNK